MSFSPLITHEVMHLCFVFPHVFLPCATILTLVEVFPGKSEFDVDPKGELQRFSVRK